jgi:hypothetical protein
MQSTKKPKKERPIQCETKTWLMNVVTNCSSFRITDAPIELCPRRGLHTNGYPLVTAN